MGRQEGESPNALRSTDRMGLSSRVFLSHQSCRGSPSEEPQNAAGPIRAVCTLTAQPPPPRPGGGGGRHKRPSVPLPWCMVRSLLKTRVSPQGIPGGAPCTARSPAHMHDTPWNQAPGCALTVDPEALREPGRAAQAEGTSAWWKMPAACSADARPQVPAEGRRKAQAGRQALPWAQTRAPTPWLVFCWNGQRKGKGK